MFLNNQDQEEANESVDELGDRSRAKLSALSNKLNKSSKEVYEAVKNRAKESGKSFQDALNEVGEAAEAWEKRLSKQGEAIKTNGKDKGSDELKNLERTAQVNPPINADLHPSPGIYDTSKLAENNKMGMGDGGLGDMALIDFGGFSLKGTEEQEGAGDMGLDSMVMFGGSEEKKPPDKKPNAEEENFFMFDL